MRSEEGPAIASLAAKPDTAGASAAEALARAWESVRLYGPLHAASVRATADMAAATSRLAGPVRLVVASRTLVIDGSPLQPERLYGGVAAALRAAGIASLTIRQPVAREGASALVTLLAGQAQRAASAEAMAREIRSVTSGSVAVHRVVGDDLAEFCGDDFDDANFEHRAALHQLLQVNSAQRLTPQAREVIELLEQSKHGSRQVPASNAGDSTARGGFALDRLHGAISRLSDGDRALIVESLSRGDLGAYPDVIAVLSRLPVQRLADAISVLARSDSHLSNASLMMLRRFAQLAIGSPSDLGRLSAIAQGWRDSNGADAHPMSQLVEAAAKLLRRTADCDFRSEEYSSLLHEMLDDDASDRPADQRVLDDFGLLRRRASQIVCDILSSEPLAGTNRSNGFEFLRSRCRALAEEGALDEVNRAIALASSAISAPANPAEAASAQKLIEASDGEPWLALALARCGDGAGVLAFLRQAHPGDDEKVADLLVRAACFTRSPGQRDAMIDAARRLDLALVLRRTSALAEADTTSRASLAVFVESLAPDQVLDILKPDLIAEEASRRSAAYHALIQTSIAWPLDLCIRALAEGREWIRIAAAEQVARSHKRHVCVLIERLGGRTGDPPLSSKEQWNLSRLLAGDTRRSTTRRLAWCALTRSWTHRRSTQAQLLLTLLAGRRKCLFSHLAMVLGRLSPLRLLPAKKVAA